jgi:hypothetical protein
MYIYKMNNIEKTHNCDICNKNYKSYKSLWNHKKSFHSNIINVENKPIEIINNKYSCDICNKNFNSRQAKFMHNKVCKEKIQKIQNEKLKEEKQNKEKEQELEITKLKKELEIKNNIIQNSIQQTQPKEVQNGGHIYLIQEREFMNTKQDVYKIGRTKDINQRVKGYPKDSRLCYTRWTPNIEQYEKDLIDLFKMNFVNKKEIGSEYFEGNENLMIKQINEYYDTIMLK